jgi:hypothetical protein
MTGSSPFSPLFLDDDARIRLQPLFDATLRLYFVGLWKDGAEVAVYGGTDRKFGTARALTDTVDTFLKANNVRPLTAIERAELHGGLLRERCATGYGTLIPQMDRRA